MRLGDLLSEEPSKNYTQVERILEKNFKSGTYKKIKQGKIICDFFCKKCNRNINFSSEDNFQIMIINNYMFSVNTALKCISCNQMISTFFIVESENEIFSQAPKLRIRKFLIDLDENLAINDYKKYDNKDILVYLDNSKQAYNIKLGAGANIYLRKIFEQIVREIANKKGIKRKDDNGKNKTFKELLEEVDNKCKIIPEEFSKDKYKLYKELSEIAHSVYDENIALEKYNYFYKLLISVLDKIKKNKELKDIVNNLGWNKMEELK